MNTKKKKNLYILMFYSKMKIRNGLNAITYLDELFDKF